MLDPKSCWNNKADSVAKYVMSIEIEQNFKVLYMNKDPNKNIYQAKIATTTFKLQCTEQIIVNGTNTWRMETGILKIRKGRNNTSYTLAIQDLRTFFIVKQEDQSQCLTC